MRIVLLTLIVLLVQAIPSFAKCKPADICEMMKKMDHFSILNACPNPNTGAILRDCRKVSEATLPRLLDPAFVDNGDETVTDTANKIRWIKKGMIKKLKLKDALAFAEAETAIVPVPAQEDAAKAETDCREAVIGLLAATRETPITSVVVAEAVNFAGVLAIYEAIKGLAGVVETGAKNALKIHKNFLKKHLKFLLLALNNHWLIYNLEKRTILLKKLKNTFFIR